jgi:hypothetical protein
MKPAMSGRLFDSGAAARDLRRTQHGERDKKGR